MDALGPDDPLHVEVALSRRVQAYVRATVWLAAAVGCVYVLIRGWLGAGGMAAFIGLASLLGLMAALEVASTRNGVACLPGGRVVLRRRGRRREFVYSEVAGIEAHDDRFWANFGTGYHTTGIVIWLTNGNRIWVPMPGRWFAARKNLKRDATVVEQMNRWLERHRRVGQLRG
jgi:hypothetical protein